jgi:hypothetical protein
MFIFLSLCTILYKIGSQIALLKCAHSMFGQSALERTYLKESYLDGNAV